jgi:hypothetical protein
MSDKNFTATIRVNRTPEEAFAAINDVRGWWTGEPGVEGGADKLGDEFTYRYGDIHYSKQKVTELIPGEKVVWQVVDARLNFTNDKTEWKGTEIRFDISEKDGNTEVRFTHLGLVPACECFDACSGAWNSYINGSLRKFIVEGEARSKNKNR